MNLNDLSTQLLYTVVPVRGKTSSGSCSGTGFFYSHKIDEERNVPFLVVNYHVVEDMIQGFVEINLRENEKPSKKETTIVGFDGEYARRHRLGELDLVAIPVAPILYELEERGVSVFYRSVDSGLIPSREALDELSALEEVTFIGYPNGISDSVNKNALIRRGITSTPVWNDYLGKPNFLIDASVFPGSSGSPVFILNQGSYSSPDGIIIGSRLLFIGILESSLLRREGEMDKRYLNLGVAINSAAFLEEIGQFADGLITKREATSQK